MEEGKEEEKKNKTSRGKESKSTIVSLSFIHSFIDWRSFSPQKQKKQKRKEQKEEKTAKQQQKTQKRKASALPGLNQRPQDLQSYALPLS